MPDRRGPARVAQLPARWWAQQSLRARLTMLATALFSFAVLTGAILLIVLQQYALTRVLDQTATKAADAAAREVASSGDGRISRSVQSTVAGIAAIQILRGDRLIAGTSGNQALSILTPPELAQVRAGARLNVTDADEPYSDDELRVLGKNVGRDTVVVFTDYSRVDDSQRVLTEAALIGGPLAVLLMAFATYGVVALTLRSVAALRHGAADITAAGLARQRLPVPSAQDEIRRLAITLNAMLDRIDSATSRQRTFVGDAAHELRSPLASLRVQLEVSRRLGPAADWDAVIDDALVDVGRLDRLVEDLLTLARLDESATPRRREPVELDELVQSVVKGYGHARVPVRAELEPAVVLGDPDSLRRIVINLVNNAVRYANSGVDVHLGARNQESGRTGKPSITLTVEDDGPGIADNERERVFDRFYRVQESRSRDTGGTGLGLPIVRDIVRMHAGSVRLAGRADGASGLRAVVVLPTARD